MYPHYYCTLISLECGHFLPYHNYNDGYHNNCSVTSNMNKINVLTLCFYIYTYLINIILINYISAISIEEIY